MEEFERFSALPTSLQIAVALLGLCALIVITIVELAFFARLISWAWKLIALIGRSLTK